MLVDGRDGPANENRLCVKGRFGFDYAMSDERLTKPLIRRDDAPKTRRSRCAVHEDVRPVPRGDMGRGAGAGRRRLDDGARPGWRRRDCRLRLCQGLERGGLSVPEVHPAGLRHQQCRPLHAAVPRLVCLRAAGRRRLRRGFRAVHGRGQGRLRHHHRRAAGNQPPGCRDLFQARRQAGHEARRHGPARAGPDAPCGTFAALQARHRCRAAERDDPHDHRRRAVRRAIYSGQRRWLRGLARQGRRFRAGDDGGCLRRSPPRR